MAKIRPEDIQAADRYLAEGDEPFNEAANGALDEDSLEGEGLDDDQLSVIIAGELQDAVRFVDLEIGRERAKATKAYRGDPYGDELEGQSSIVSRDVHDTIQGQLPDIMRVLLGSDSPCEYEPQTEADEANVKQMNEYAQYAIMRDNDGFSEIYSVVKEALNHKVGLIKYWWDDTVKVKTEHYRNLDEMGLFVLQQDGDVEMFEVTEADTTGLALPPDPQTGQPPTLYDATVKRRTTQGRFKLACIPPEEFIIDRRARSLNDFTLCGHRSMPTVGYLVSLGYDEETVRQFVTSPELDTNIEYIERQPYARAVGSFDALNPATQRVLYVEAYAWVDRDGDGIAELCKVCTMGPAYKVVSVEEVDHIPFADFHCDPEPHTFFGLSTADKTMDIQRIKTHIQRNMYDSLAQSIHSRMAVVEGQVNIEDVMNNEVGALIRMRAPGMVMPLDTPFVGQQALPILDYIDSTREMRTGVSRQQVGLDAEDLQSTNQLAIEQSISGSQGKIELICRIMANGMRKLYKGFLHLAVQNQDRPRMIKLTGGFVSIDPRTWNADLDVKINVALGTGTQAQKLQSLMVIISKQELILQTMGMNQPIVTPTHYANSLRKLCELSGWRNADQFFAMPPPGWQPAPPPPPPPDPKVQLGMQQLAVQKQKNDQDFQVKLMQEHRERDQNVSDALLRSREMELRYISTIDSAQINQEGAMAQAHASAMHSHHAEELRQGSESHRQLLDHIADMAKTTMQMRHDAQLQREAAAQAKTEPKSNE